jgi:hypothetical protein
MTTPPGPGISTLPPITETYPGIIQRPSGPPPST